MYYKLDLIIKFIYNSYFNSFISIYVDIFTYFVDNCFIVIKTFIRLFPKLQLP